MRARNFQQAEDAGHSSETCVGVRVLQTGHCALQDVQHAFVDLSAHLLKAKVFKGYSKLQRPGGNEGRMPDCLTTSRMISCLASSSVCTARFSLLRTNRRSCSFSSRRRTFFMLSQPTPWPSRTLCTTSFKNCWFSLQPAQFLSFNLTAWAHGGPSDPDKHVPLPPSLTLCC